MRLYAYPDRNGTNGSLEIWHLDVYQSSVALTHPVEGIKNADNQLEYLSSLLKDSAGSIEMILRYECNYDFADLAAEYLVGLSSSATGPVYEGATDGQIQAADGINTNTLTVNWSRGDRLKILIDWDDSVPEMKLVVYDVDTGSQIGTTQTASYDGTWDRVGGILRVCSRERPKILESLKTWDKPQGIV